MKTIIVPKRNQRGSILLVSLVITFIIGITLASYLIMSQSQNVSVARSQTWNASIALSEAGVEDALAMLNKNKNSGEALSAWTDSASACNWESLGNNVYHVQRYLGSSYYDAYITNQSSTPTISSAGVVPWNYSYASAPQSFFAAAGVGGSSRATVRKLEVRTHIDALFNVCMAALGAIDLKGNGIASDSFDSSDPNYSTNGYYYRPRRKAGGDIVTNNTITNSVLNVGNANIAGHVTTGPNGSIQQGPNDSVGDLAWVDSNTPGIKPGWSGNDLNVVFDNIVLPNVIWTFAAGNGTGGPGRVNGINYSHVFTSPFNTYTTPGNYTINDSGDIYVGTNVSVRLNITASTFNPSSIYVAGVAANEVGTMVGYLNGPPGQSVTLGTDDKTQSGKAENLAFLGLPTCTAIAYKGNGDFTGVIYAPQADFQLAGGGAGTIDFIGSSVTRTVQMNGHYNFHYDENLRRVGPSRGYVPTNWKEVH
jgi:hypothetical protein